MYRATTAVFIDYTWKRADALNKGGVLECYKLITNNCQ